ncbi:MAG: hypothetical protein AAF645_11280 [Myxococcota bacterium]
MMTFSRSLLLLVLPVALACGDDDVPAEDSGTADADAEPPDLSADVANDAQEDSAPDAVPDAPSDLGGPPWEGPRIPGIFLLGPDDYDVHAEKMGGAPALVHFFVDWFGAEQLAASNADPSTRVEPPPIDPDGLRFLDFIYPDAVVALSWAMPLPNFDVPGPAWPNVPTVRDLLTGRYDDYIRDFARSLAPIEKEIWLTMFGEFDNNVFYAFGPEGLSAAADDPGVAPAQRVPTTDDLNRYYGDPELPDGPERVRDAFIRVIDIFREEGATNVKWFMYGSSGYLGGGEQDALITPTLREGVWNVDAVYPGDEYIDFVGKSLHHGDLASLRETFEPAYEAWTRVSSRPFFAPEFSILAGGGIASRAEQIREEFGSYFPSFPRFAAFASVDPVPESSNDEFVFYPYGGADDEFPDEVAAWRETVVESDAWQTR